MAVTGPLGILEDFVSTVWVGEESAFEEVVMV